MGNLTDTMKSSTLRSQKSKLPETPTEEAPMTRSAVIGRSAPAIPQEDVGDSSGIGYPDSNKSDSNKSDKSNPKKRRAYDKTYRTNEPLPNAPEVEFPEKPWDLSEEDLLSITSPSDTESNRDSTLTRPAKDIEYVSKPRQLGRRALPSDSGYSTKESEDPYSPKYEGQYSPIPSQYSPTYSDIYSPPISPTSDNSPRNTFNNTGLPETPKSAPSDAIKTFTMPPQKGKSMETLIDPPVMEVPSMSSRSTMV